MHRKAGSGFVGLVHNCTIHLHFIFQICLTNLEVCSQPFWPEQELRWPDFWTFPVRYYLWNKKEGGGQFQFHVFWPRYVNCCTLINYEAELLYLLCLLFFTFLTFSSPPIFLLLFSSLIFLLSSFPSRCSTFSSLHSFYSLNFSLSLFSPSSPIFNNQCGGSYLKACDTKL